MFVISSTVFSQITANKNIKENYKFTNTGKLYLENQYGDITINGWDKDEIEIDINIEVTDHNNEDAKNILNRINPRFRNTNNYLNIISEISEKNDNLFSKYFRKLNPFSLEKSNISINYSIHLPINVEIEISNKFGDVIINDWHGKLKTTLKHGDIWVSEAINSAEIDLKYGKIKIKSMDYATINLKNGNIEIDDVEFLNLTSSGSEINIKKIDELKLISNKDNGKFNYLKSVRGDFKFSSILIRELGSKINITSKITDLEILKIIPPNPNIEINQISSNIDINISSLSFVFEATLEQGTLRLPKSFKNIKTRMIDKGRKIREINAIYGTTKSGTISLTGKKGNITLNE